MKEFRETTIKERQRADALAAELAAAKAAAEKAGPANGEAKTLTDRVEHLTKIVEGERTARAAAEAQSRASAWESSFTRAAHSAKVRDEKAAKVLLSLAKQTFKEDKNGNYVATDDKGATVFSPKGTDPISIGEWMESQRGGDYRDLFAQPQGGGAKGPGAFGFGGKTPKVTITSEQAKGGDYIDQLASGEAVVSE